MNDKSQHAGQVFDMPMLNIDERHGRTSKALFAAIILITTIVVFYRYDLVRSSRPDGITRPSAEPLVMEKIDFDPAKRTDLDWIPAGLPTGEQLKTTNPFAAERMATGPLGKPEGKAFDWEDFSPKVLQKFWDVWVGHLNLYRGSKLMDRSDRSFNLLSTSYRYLLILTLCLKPILLCTPSTTLSRQRRCYQISSSPRTSCLAGRLRRSSMKERFKRTGKGRQYG